MDIEKLIEAVKLCGSTPKVDQCKQCVYWAGGDMSRCIPNMTGDAATALSALQAENEKLRAELERVNENQRKVFNEEAVLKLAGQALGITLDRLRELVQADRKGTNCTPAERSEEIGQKKAVAHAAEAYGERMLGFLHSFKTELEKQFGPMESDWDARSRTVGWASSLKAASEKHLPEIWALWDALDWWASDLLDSWITDCAVYMGFCKGEESENAAD